MRLMRNRWSRTGLLMLACSGGVLLVEYGREWIAVDRCLDAGGVYDYLEGRCRKDVVHLPHVSFAIRRHVLLAVTGFVAPGGIVLILLGWRKRWHTL